jgi:two-component system, OmpR family, alkaline phosphatase synthesis response regulator PhoP
MHQLSLKDRQFLELAYLSPKAMNPPLRDSHASILLVEDEEALRLMVGDRLRSEGYTVEYAANGDEAFEKAILLGFDVLLLDIMLPGRDGFSLCRDIRQAGLITPILMLTARTQVQDKVTGLKLGADDYLTKPFDMQELIARIDALLRRAPIRPAVKEEPYQFGDITIDLRGTRVTRHGEHVCLSAREFQLLQYFIEHPGATLSREELLREVWGYKDGTYSRTVDVHVASLRHKLEGDSKQPKFISTVTRLGYKFTP